MDLLVQLQADQLGVPVARPAVQETTALGAAYLAGLAEGVWSSTDEVAQRWRLDLRCEPAADRADVDARHRRWRRAVERIARLGRHRADRATAATGRHTVRPDPRLGAGRRCLGDGSWAWRGHPPARFPTIRRGCRLPGRAGPAAALGQFAQPGRPPGRAPPPAGARAR